MIEYITQDITKITHGVIAHGCNCQGKMGAGVAHAIRKRWPVVYFEYVDLCIKTNPQQLLGSAQIVTINNTDISFLAVANCFTQEYYGRDGKTYASRSAIRTALIQPIRLAAERGVPFFTSRIGCNLGGLDWDVDVEPIMSALSDEFDITIMVCDK